MLILNIIILLYIEIDKNSFGYSNAYESGSKLSKNEDDDNEGY